MLTHGRGRPGEFKVDQAGDELDEGGGVDTARRAAPGQAGDEEPAAGEADEEVGLRAQIFAQRGLAREVEVAVVDAKPHPVELGQAGPEGDGHALLVSQYGTEQIEIEGGIVALEAVGALGDGQ